ncbi:sensor histidine kinase [Oceanobacillus massiliensis]|uniref:sensor histidine kinase n=2 Tax=Oceanobacillus massiliensis TaxID=1465765 RepID=UPI0002EB4456|nr:sensor histidine kinase [Oceanobacillus massiliensis]
MKGRDSMKSYWLWLLLNSIVWLFALTFFEHSILAMAGILSGAALFAGIFFIIPIFTGSPKIVRILLILNAMISIIIFFPYINSGFNPYLILILTMLVGEGFYRLSLKEGLILAIIIFAGLLAALLNTGLALYIQTFVILYFIILLIAMIFYKKNKGHTDDLEVRYDTLLREYRDLKRRLASEEEITRQEERMLIAHEIHDSVGHKLTALLLQLEAYRIQAAVQDKIQVQSLKELAEASLEETRSAVKSLKSKETGGLPGILRLIRKLESESYMRIHFSVKHGAFTAPLTGEQSFIIYRSVQEALTNIMKHSHAREAEIEFDAPGRSIFRFEVNNPISDHRTYQEGFGLTSMRNRLEKFGGNLEVYKTAEQFTVRGFLKIGYGGLE